MKIKNNTDKFIKIQIGYENADEPDYDFILSPRGLPNSIKNLKEDNIDLNNGDLIVINNGEAYHEP